MNEKKVLYSTRSRERRLPANTVKYGTLQEKEW
jgi:hypothetical protein